MPRHVLALVLALVVVTTTSLGAAAQDAGCAHPDPTMGCPRTAPFTAREVRAQLAFAEHSVARCAWEFLGTHTPNGVTVTIPGPYTPRTTPLTIQPTTFGAPAADEQHFLECIAYYASPSLPYRGRPITARLSLRLPRAMPRLEPAVRGAIAARGTEIGECLDQGFPPSVLLVVIQPSGSLSLRAIRSPTATYDSSRGVPLGCAGSHIGRLSVPPPHREVSVEIAWPLSP